jgi:hypothetical protein
MAPEATRLAFRAAFAVDGALERPEAARAAVAFAETPVALMDEALEERGPAILAAATDAATDLPNAFRVTAALADAMEAAPESARASLAAAADATEDAWTLPVTARFAVALASAFDPDREAAEAAFAPTCRIIEIRCRERIGSTGGCGPKLGLGPLSPCPLGPLSRRSPFRG